MKLLIMWNRKSRGGYYTYQILFTHFSQIAFSYGISVGYVSSGVVPTLNKHIMIVNVKGDIKEFSEELRKEGYEVFEEVSDDGNVG